MPCGGCGRKYFKPRVSQAQAAAADAAATKLVPPVRGLTRSQKMRAKRGVIKAQPQPQKASVTSDPRKGMVDPSTGQLTSMMTKGECGEDITCKTSSGPGFVNRYPEAKDA